MQIYTTVQNDRPVIELTPQEKGQAFEDYIVTLFTKRKYRLLDWRSDKKASNGIYPLSSTHPDLQFDYRGMRYTKFAVECKWRSQFYGDKLTWAYEDQIRNYLNYQFQNAITVYVAIGVGGKASNPNQLFITPLDCIKMDNEVSRSHLLRYKIDPIQTFENSEQLSLFF